MTTLSLRDLGFLGGLGGGGGADPYFANVSLLLHGDGTNGSTSIIDSSPRTKAVTAVGNAQIITTIADPFSRTGVGIIAFDGSFDGLTIPSSSDFSFTADFTFEFWLRFVTIPSAFIALTTGLGANTQMFITTLGNGTGLRWGLTGVAEYHAANYTWTTGTWFHVAVVRNSNLVRFYVNGTNISGAGQANTNSFSGNISIANSVSGTVALHGNIDDLRITNGIARTIPLPTAPFPDF
jgi:hypothetical protein